jgi:hypothetical protein
MDEGASISRHDDPNDLLAAAWRRRGVVVRKGARCKAGALRFPTSLRPARLTADANRECHERSQSSHIRLKTAVSGANPMDKRRRSRAKPQLGWLRVLMDIPQKFQAQANPVKNIRLR